MLPLKLTYFTGQLQRNEVKLNWHTEAEINVDGYNLERSTNGIDYQSIHFIIAKGGIDNDYIYTDPVRINNIIIYRLKMTDKNGSIIYSPVVILKNKNGNAKLQVSPIPARDQIKIVNATQDLNGKGAKVTDAEGRIIYNFTIQPGNQIDISKWANGTYYIRTISGAAIPFIKQ